MSNVGRLEFDASIDTTKFQQNINKMEQSIKQIEQSSDGAFKNTKNDLDGIAGSAGKAGVGFKGLMSALLPVASIGTVIAGISSLTSKVIAVRSEFEKYEATLTNSLGSQTLAKQAMGELTDFAAKTPFALSELTGAYVKLTNYGLKPNMESMRAYGDIASSVGKSFDQFAEAAADAVTGEFERLKEFGIKASKEGDKVTFTFKEQKTVVENNATAINEYIKSLGNMEGVAGSMAAVSETLGGKISNMGDAWDRLLNSMGNESSGVFVTVIEYMTKLIENVEALTKSAKTLKNEALQKTISNSGENALLEIETIKKGLIKNGMSESDAVVKSVELYKNQMSQAIDDAQKKLDEANSKKGGRLDRKEYKELEKEIATSEENLKLLQGELDIINAKYKDIAGNQDKVTVGDQIKKITGEIKNAESELSKMRLSDSLFSPEDIEKQENKISGLKKTLALLTGVSKNGKKSEDEQAIDGSIKYLEKKVADLKKKEGTFLNKEAEAENAEAINALLDQIALKKLEVQQLVRDDTPLKKMEKTNESYVKSTKEQSTILAAYQKLGLKQGEKLTDQQKILLDIEIQKGIEAENRNTFALATMDSITEGEREILKIEQQQADTEVEKWERIKENVSKTILLTSELNEVFGTLGNAFGGFNEEFDQILSDTQNVIGDFTTVMEDIESKQEASIGDYSNLISLAISVNTWAFNAVGKIASLITGKDMPDFNDFTRDLMSTESDRLELKMGFSSNDIAQQISDGIIEGMQLGADGSLGGFSDSFTDMLKKSIQKALVASFNEKELKAFQENIDKYMVGGLSDEELILLQEEYKALIEKGNERAKLYESILGNIENNVIAETDKKSAMQGAISSISEETAGLIEGRLNSIQFNVIDMKKSIDSQLASLQKIEYNTGFNHFLEGIPDNLVQLRAIAQTLAEMKNAGNNNYNATGLS